MEYSDLIETSDRNILREWLLSNHRNEKEVWIVVNSGKTTETDSLYYIDIVEEALCFGWIDSTKKRIDGKRTIQRISPRSKRSNWTELNKERVRRLEKHGKMTSAGRESLPEMSLSKFSIDKDILDKLRLDEIAYSNFLAFPKLYQRIRVDNIQGYKKDTDTYLKRLQKLFDTSKKGIMYGNWDDNGRLTDY